ncbi:MAG: thioredoxin-disulfide reductase [Candidatus Thermoplasmatota archaeon]
MDFELVIIGGGPAGYAASIYASRSGIKNTIFDKGDGGGLASIAPKIENYPGFESISGSELTEKMKHHAEKYTDFHLFEEVKKLEKIDDHFKIITEKDEYTSKTVILATGTEHRKLNAPGEKKLLGKGVSYCATCDGFFFKDKKVAMVGGGNSALIEAVYLKQIGCKKVYLLHRRDQLRAEKAYEDEAIEKGVEILFNKEVEKINGEENVESLTIKDKNKNKTEELQVDGVFISIGVVPQNKLAKQVGIKTDNKGYIVTDKEMKTNVDGIYAAGDITGGIRQIITAASRGAIAALSSTEALGKNYPY